MGDPAPMGPTYRAELEGWLATRPTLPSADDVAHLWARSPPTRPDAAVPVRRTTCGSRPPVWPMTCLS